MNKIRKRCERATHYYRGGNARDTERTALWNRCPRISKIDIPEPSKGEMTSLRDWASCIMHRSTYPSWATQSPTHSYSTTQSYDICRSGNLIPSHWEFARAITRSLSLSDVRSYCFNLLLWLNSRYEADQGLTVRFAFSISRISMRVSELSQA